MTLGSLRDLDLRDSYRSDRATISRDFYVPCLRRTLNYSRAAGYFTSASLSVLAEGLGPFVDRGGSIRLVVSPHLNEDDAQAIARGYGDRERILAGVLKRELSEEMPDPTKRRLELLAWLIAAGRLDIKIALVETGGGLGLYHEKFGVFQDEAGHTVAFSGSANESVGGLIANFESIDVYRSWVPADAGRAQEKRDQFDTLWLGRTSHLTVYEFPAAARERLLEFRPPKGQLPSDATDEVAQAEAIHVGARREPALPAGLEPRDYQEDAVRRWLESEGRGIWEMATGTGKTITALCALLELWDRASAANRPMLVVISCPLRHLVTQWAEECRRFGFLPTLCFGSAKDWASRLSDRLASIRARQQGNVVAVTTNDTLMGEAFQQQLQNWSDVLVLIADEVHNLGAPTLYEALPEHAHYRLGLSATPERWMDQAGTARLRAYFGEIVYSLGLQDAIQTGALTRYKYFPIVVELDEDEAERYLELSSRIGRALRGASDTLDDADLLDGPLKQLLFARARLIGGARGKLTALTRLMKPLRETTHNLVYCSDATQMGVDGDEEAIRQLDAAVAALGNELRMTVDSYTHRNTMPEREELRRRFTSGELQALVAIRCLDEGVDIPAIRRAFILASATNPRQFIQRRGRILRTHPGKSTAELYDFVVAPPLDVSSTVEFGAERSLVRRELIRVMEFAESADNGPEAIRALLPLRERYHLLQV